MSPKNVVLIAAAAIVVAMCLYLFVQVRSTPAQAGSSESHAPAPPNEAILSRPAPAPTQTPSAMPAPVKPPPVGGSAASSIRVGNDVIPPAAMAGSDDVKANPKLDAMMEQATKAYDRQDYDDAIAIAGKMLSKDPTNVRMLRIMVSANCIQGDTAVAQQYYDKLPRFDRDQMKTRCDRYGVTFKEPSP